MNSASDSGQNVSFGNFVTSKKLQKCIVPSSHRGKVHYILHKYSVMYVVSGPLFQICDTLCYSKVIMLESAEVC